MKILSNNNIEEIVAILIKNKPLSKDYKEALISQLNNLKHSLLFDAKKEYELIYEDKEREEDILADTMAVPLQKVKTFRNGELIQGTVPDLRSEARRIGTVPDSWTNMLIFGDNLQVLKTLLQMKEKGKLKNADGTPGPRLIYIDPPFATKQEFRGSQDQKAYQDKIAGARFLEFLRKRLVFLRELLSEDGSIYVHLDQKKGHYIKIVLDEIFGEQYFLNEIVWKRSAGHSDANQFGRVHDVLYLYAKNSRYVFSPQAPYEREEGSLERAYPFTDEKGRRYSIDNLAAAGAGMAKRFGDKIIKPPDGQHWRYSQDNIDKLWTEGRIVFNKNGIPRVIKYADETNRLPVQDIWSDCIMHISTVTGYPTEKSEKLMQRIIKASSNPGDLVLDVFSGSGTTCAVSEKLGRRWIGVDCGKLAIYTMQKRLLNIADSKDFENPRLVPSGSKTGKKYGKQCKPFTLYNAGLYDYKMIKELPWEQYRDFALKLFQCQDEIHEISKIELDGYLGRDSVMVFNYQKYKDAMMDRGFIDDLHKYLGNKIAGRFFIIVPAASVQFLEDYIERGKTKYYILRIPYSIIEEIHNRGFTKIKQPVSEMDVNDTVDAVGFDFIQVPTVECKYYLDKPKSPDLLNQKTKECVIEIKKFESKILSRKPMEFANLETLSMVMLDYDFDGEVFDLDEVFYAEDLKKHALSEAEGNNYEVRFAEDRVKGQMMIIYIDIFGNEKREVKNLKDFKGKGDKNDK